MGFGLVAALAALGGPAAARAQEIPRFATKGWFDFKAPALKDPVLQHAKETYIQYGCAYCHNVDLHPRGEAADLMHSPIVAADADGEAIAQVLKSGIPQTAKLSPMPQFSDLSERELHDIARWIHYARMEGRFAELMQGSDGGGGNPGAGQAYFERTCRGCHAVADLRKALSAVPAAGFRAAALKPALLEETSSFVASPATDARAEARRRHSRVLENISDEEATNLVAYLRGESRR